MKHLDIMPIYFKTEACVKAFEYNHEDLAAYLTAYSRPEEMHAKNVMKTSTLIGILMGLTEYERFILCLGGLYHDIGKLQVSPKILYKKDKLTDEEFEEVKQHPKKGFEVLKTIDNLDDKVLDIALHHHERLDGKGYPDGLTDIDLLTRIVSVADVYDALVSKRTYKEVLSIQKSLQIIGDDDGLDLEIKPFLIDLCGYELMRKVW